MSKELVIVVGSDLCPTNCDEELFISGDCHALLGAYHDLWTQADYRLLNLECPLTGSDNRIQKVGPHLKASPDCVAFLSASRTDAVCLANNHLCDYGEEGVFETIDVCERAQIATVGAGRNLAEARRPLSTEVKGIRLGIMALAEAEFSIATRTEAGANPIDYANYSVLRELRAKSDIVIVLIHGGTEYLQFPRPGLVQLCRFLVDQGAGAIIVQHTHCIGCQEIYQEAPILYGQGNFIFASRRDSIEQVNPIWFEGLLCELRISVEKKCRIHFHPYEQSRGFAGVRPLSAERQEKVFQELRERSELLADPAAHQRAWQEFVTRRRNGVLCNSIGVSGLLAGVNHRLPLVSLLHTPGGMRRRLSMVRCESHRELLHDCLLSDIR